VPLLQGWHKAQQRYVIFSSAHT
jgi:small subunit ribosomal protein S7e